MTEFSIIAVFFVGLLGGVHCLGMCGSIVGILTGQLPEDGARWPFNLAYHSGRIARSARSVRQVWCSAMWCRYSICCLRCPA